MIMILLLILFFLILMVGGTSSGESGGAANRASLELRPPFDQVREPGMMKNVSKKNSFFKTRDKRPDFDT